MRGFLLYVRAGGAGGRVVSESTVRTYRHAIAHLCRWLSAVGRPGLLAVTRELALEWAAELARTRAPATAQLYVTAARLLYDWLVAEGELREERHPLRRVRGPRVPERRHPPLSADEVQRIFAYLERQGRSVLALRNLACLALLCDTGLRVSECLALRLDDVDWRSGVVRVVGKGGRPRQVPVGPGALRALDRYLRERARRGQTGDALWLDRSGRPWSDTGVRRLHREIGQAVGVTLHPHRWRHTYLQTLLERGLDRETVRLLAGHQRLDTLRVYTAATDEARAVATARRHSVYDSLRLRRPGTKR